MKKNMTINILPFQQQLMEATLLGRERRFFIKFTDSFVSQAELDDKNCRYEFAHTNNTGSMMGIIRAGRKILLSKSDNPKRKLTYTLEAVNLNREGQEPLWLGVNTSVPNRFLQELFYLNKAYDYELLPFAENFAKIKMEAKNGESRLDACLYNDDNQPKLWVECKNVSMVEYDAACFPDAVSERGQKHLETLMRLKREGDRAVMFYVVQRTDAACFMPAEFIDPVYAEKLQKAYKAGVEVYAVLAEIQKNGIYFGGYLKLAPCYFNV